jgi:putative intracellular protease/amidase
MDVKTVHVAVYDTLADWEVGYAIAQINTPDYQRHPGRYRVVTVAETAEPITTTGGVRIVPDMALDDLRPDDSAMLILPGGRAWDEHKLASMARTAREFLKRDVPVAAICGATAGLAREGLLDDRAHTSSAPEYLAATGYEGADRYVREAAVTDGPLITAGPQAAVDFAREIFRRLDLYEPAILDAWYALYRHQDSAPFMAMMTAESEPSAAR